MKGASADPCAKTSRPPTMTITRITGSNLSLPSGAGHDGVVLSKAMPIAMLFIRCRAGLSHHPDEHAEPGDIAIGINVLADFLKHRTLP